MSRRRTTEGPPAQTNPPLATQDEIDAVVAQANAEPPAVGEPGGAAPQPEPAKRKRRSAIEMFADQKQEHADVVLRAEGAMLQAKHDHEAAIEAQELFLVNARAALGL